MITYFHIILMPLCVFILIAIWRLWACIDRLNFMPEVTRRAPSMFQGNLLAAVLAIGPFLLAALSWSGISLPGQTMPMSANVAVFMSVASLGVCLLLLKNSMQYLALSWAGSRVGALRLVAMLRIIDAAELAYALQYIQARETSNTGRVIDAETLREVRK